ncbi:Hsp20/alpha crystallin family protein [[Eubacterium] cellulosolvens]
MSLYKKRRGREVSDAINIITIFIGIIVVGVILTLLVRFQRGLLGVVLGGLAVALVIYWILEIRKTMKTEFKVKEIESGEWTPDIIENKDEIVIVGKVPGPREKIKVLLEENFLEVKGGLGFRKVVKLPSKIVSFNTSYTNGVLEVRLKK